MANNSKFTRRKQAGAEDCQASSSAPRSNAQAGDWARYESLKSELTAKATTPAEHAAACQRAAEIAGV